MNRSIIKVILCAGLIIYSIIGNAQVSGFVKPGLNFGFINQEWWTYFDSIKYDKPLIRPIISVGGQYSSKNWFIRQELMFQIKGQGTITPDVRSGFRTENPDVLRFISLPLSVHHKIIWNLYAGIGIQPSLYISGTDNYWSKDGWKGWIWGTTMSLQYLTKFGEIGFEYDHDLILYYCPGCGIRFYTYRLYGTYHFESK